VSVIVHNDGHLFSRKRDCSYLPRKRDLSETGLGSHVKADQVLGPEISSSTLHYSSHLFVCYGLKMLVSFEIGCRRRQFSYLCNPSGSFVLPAVASFALTFPPTAAVTVCACGLVSSTNDGLSEAVSAYDLPLSVTLVIRSS
jgi:hypothetical protein